MKYLKCFSEDKEEILFSRLLLGLEVIFSFLLIWEEMEKVVRRRSVLLGYDGDCLVGFIGEHLEGSMGLLYVFPEYRRRGFGAALQTHYIVKTMENGCVPFGQVEKDNRNSLKLQEKIGMTRSDNLIVWMWRLH